MMDLVSIIKAILPVDPAALKTDVKGLQPGDHLLGRVLKLHADGKVMMAFDTFKALTEVPIKVRVGQTLNLQVAQVGNPLKLRIVPPTSQPQGNSPPDASAKPGAVPMSELLRQFSSDLELMKNTAANTHANSKTAATAYEPQSIQATLKTLGALISSLDMASDTKTLAAELKSKVENSGILYEKKLAAALETLSKSQVKMESAEARALVKMKIGSDLKPNVLQLLDYIDTLDQKTSNLDESLKQRLHNALKELIDDVGQQKNVAAKRLSGDDPFQIFQMVLPLPDKQEAAKLKVYYPKKQKGETQPHPKVSLLLDLKNLGLVRSDFLLMQRDLAVMIYVSDSSLKNYFEAQIEPIRKVLEEDFEAVSLAVRVSEKKIKDFDAPLQTKNHDHQVDLRI